MGKKVTEKIDSFDAIAESGERFKIIVYQEFHIDSTLNRGPRKRPGIKSLSTHDGKHVQMIDENTYEIEGLNLRVTKL